MHFDADADKKFSIAITILLHAHCSYILFYEEQLFQQKIICENRIGSKYT